MKTLLAVRGGFEPPEQLPVRQFSKLVVSATHPPHQWGCKYSIIKIPLQVHAPKFFVKFPNLSPFKCQNDSVFL